MSTNEPTVIEYFESEFYYGLIQDPSSTGNMNPIIAIASYYDTFQPVPVSEMLLTESENGSR